MCRGRESPEAGAPRSSAAVTENPVVYLSGHGIFQCHRLLHYINGRRHLNAHGKTDIDSAEQAAEALRPIAGQFASLLFSLGIVGTGLLALPVLAGSGAYAIGEALGWPVGLERKPSKAIGFYVVIALATLIGLLLNFFGINPIRALVWSAIINGLAAAPVMCFMMLMASSSKVMGKFALPAYLKIVGWAGTLIMILAAAGMLWPSTK